MRYILVSAFVFMWILFSIGNTYGQNDGDGCLNGKRHGIYYTDCWARAKGENNDTRRLQDAIDAASGKLIFNETGYTIDDRLGLHSYLIIEGLGNNPFPGEGPATSIVQTNPNECIFFIGNTIHEVSIRDISLSGDLGETSPNAKGILAAGTYAPPPSNTSSLFFQFSNIRFEHLAVGIDVEPTETEKQWQFDDVRLDHSSFVDCTVGVHVNSSNSGWSITGIDMVVPANGIGFYFENSTYTSLNLVIGNGPPLGGSARGEAFIKIVRHGNLSIQNAVSEGFVNDVVINGVNETTRSFPISLINNHFMHGLDINNATVMSTGNQFGFQASPTSPNYVAKVVARGYSQIYSVGDKFCLETQLWCKRNEKVHETDPDLWVDYSNYKIEAPAKMIHSAIETSSVSTLPLTLQKGNFWFDITRSDVNGSLTFSSHQQGAGFTFNAYNSEVKINDGNLNFNNGTITLGTTLFANRNAGTTTPGTLYFCSDCKANASTGNCEGSGTGAIAKKLNATDEWKCN